RDLMDANVATVMREPRHERHIALALGLELRRHVGLVAKFPYLILRADRESPRVGLIRDTHRAEEMAKVRVQLIAVRAHEDELPRLIRRDDERDAESAQQLGEVTRVVTLERFGLAVIGHGVTAISVSAA